MIILDRFVILAGLLSLVAGCHRAPSVKADPLHQMVAAKYRIEQDGDHLKWKYYVSRIDLRTNTIVSETQIPEEPYQLLELPNGSVVVTFCRAPGTYQKKLGIIDSDGKYKRFLRTAQLDPNATWTFGKEVMVLEGGAFSGPLHAQWVTQKGKSKRVVKLDDSAMLNIESICYSPREKAFLMAADVFSPGHLVTANNMLIKLYPQKGTFTKKQWPYYWTAPNLCFIASTNKVLVGPVVDERISQEMAGHIIHRIDIVGYPNFNLIKIILLEGIVRDIVYAPDVEKAYVRVEYFDTKKPLTLRPMEYKTAVIDLKTNRLLGYLKFQSSTIHYEGHHRLACDDWQWEYRIDPATGSYNLYKKNTRLILLDTRTDTVVAEFPGDYHKVGIDAEIQNFSRQ